jgi:hypothetical protein
MRAQLDRLQTVIGVPNVRPGIIPLGVKLDTEPQNNFVLYDDVAKVETFVRRVVPHRRPSRFLCGDRESPLDDGLEGDAARRLIIRAADELPAA